MYELLRIPQDAARADIEQAFSLRRRAAQKQNADLRPLQEAFNVLADENSRRRYDQKLARLPKAHHESPFMLQNVDLDEDSLGTVHMQMNRAMSKQRLKHIDLFRQLDADGSGRVGITELSGALKELGLHIPKEFMASIFRNFDKDGSGWVDYEEFRKIMSSKQELLVEELPDEVRLALGLKIREVLPEEPEGATTPRRSMSNWRYAGTGAMLMGSQGMGRGVRLQPLPFRRVSIGRGADAFDAWQLVSDVHMNNRGPSQLAVVTHPLQTGTDADSVEEVVKRRPLHHALVKDGWNVIAYEGCRLSQDGTGEDEVAKLRAVMQHVSADRKLRYCRCALVTQGTGASAAFKAMTEHPDSFDYVVKAISACQPGGVESLQEALVTKYAPNCSLPVLLSHAPRVPSAEGRARPITPAVVKFSRAIPEKTPQQTIEVNNYPLYGKAKRFEGSHYFGDNPNKLLGFLGEHTKPPRRSLMPSASAPTLTTRIGKTSSLRTTISAARLAVSTSGGADAGEA